jgi:RNase adapter protein RapZ
MKLILITGMSGAGKSVALKTLEDCGFEAIDNIPLAMLPSIAFSNGSSVNRPRNIVVGADTRGRDFSVDHVIEIIALLKENPAIDFKMLFLDSDNEILRRRFTETRRRHPLAQDRPVMDGIQHERSLIWKLRDIADTVMDTSEYEAADLRKTIISHFAVEERHLSIVLTSFSFKKGIPRDADMVLDVRFLLNPFYDPKLQHLSGLDAEVGAFIEKDPDFTSFYTHLTLLIAPLLPRYLEEGKNYLTLAIGCTGGQHRSVYMVEKLGGFLQEKGYNVTLRHRNLKEKL